MLFTKAIQLYPKFEGAYYNRGIAEAALGNYKAAIVDYTKAIEIYPNWAEAYNNRSLAYQKLGNVKKAEEDLKKAKSLKHITK